MRDADNPLLAIRKSVCLCVRTFINFLLRDADNPPIAVRDTWSAIQNVLHSAISKQQLTAAVT